MLQSFSLADETIRQIIFTLIVLVILLVVTRLGQRLITRYVDEPVRRYRSSKLIGRMGGVIALILLLIIWSPGPQNIVTILTVIGAGLAIAMREALLSVVGWFNIIFRTPYTQGDRIEINELRGDVIDIRLFHTTLMEVGAWVDADQSTGRIVHFPNSWNFQHSLHNYSRGFRFIWNEITLTVTFRSDWNAAREVMLSMAMESAHIIEQQASREIRRMSREYLVHYSILTPFVYVRIVPNGVQLTLRYLCEVRKRRGTEHALTISILEAFKEHGNIELAYPMVGVTAFDTGQFGPIPDMQSRSHQDPPEKGN